jgi:hypothetical protein
MYHKLKYPEIFSEVKICTNMQKNFFLTDSTGYEMQTFLTPIKQYMLVKNMVLHKNPDSIDQY